MDRVPVKSSNIKSVGHEQQILEIEFHSGAIYSYSGVPEKVYTELMSASSHGVYFNKNIKEKYQTNKIQ